MNNLLKSEKTVDKILLGFSILCLVMILSLSANAFLNGGDDYNFLIELKNGVLQNCIRGYFDWDGRLLTIGAFVQGFCLLYLPIEITVLIWSFSFLISGFLIYCILKNEIDFSILNKEKRMEIRLLLPIVLWLGSFKHLPETVYWGTGGVYSFDLLIGALWTVGFLYLQKNKMNFATKIGFALFSIIAGASTENLSIALITLALITILVDFLENKKTNQWFNFLILIAVILGLLFIALAPGNFLRIDEIKKIEKPDLTILFLLKSLFHSSTHFLYWSAILCFLSFIVGVAISFQINPKIKFNTKFEFYNFKTKPNWISFFNNTKWFWVALSTITPFITIPEVVSTRTSIYFMFFIMIFIIVFTIKIIRKYSLPTNEIRVIENNMVLTRTIFFIQILCCMIFISYNFYKGIQLKKAIKERETILINGKNKTVYLKLIDSNLKTVLFNYSDLIIDGKPAPGFIKAGQESYFKTKIIIKK